MTPGTGTLVETADPGLVGVATRFLLFTGKGGVGKTTLACATAVALADRGARVLLVSTDPASNLDEVLRTPLSGSATAIVGVPGLHALNVDPEAAALAYRERVVGPYRGVLPEETLRSVEEQLSGACTVEIAAFDEFAKLLGNAAAGDAFDHVIFDTAPTGHTLRLLQLPAAWTDFLKESAGGVSCLGPLSALGAQRELYAAAVAALSDHARTTLVLVSRPEDAPLAEAERTRRELAALGVGNARLVLNGVFTARDLADPLARAIEAEGRAALEALPAGLAGLPRTVVPLRAVDMVGVEALRAVFGGEADSSPSPMRVAAADPAVGSMEALLDDLAGGGRGVVMTMGKGGVGKTAVARTLAVALARRGHRVHLTTTDPAGRIDASLAAVPGLRVSRIDPAAETRRCTAEVLAGAGAGLNAEGRALMEEDLRSPCTEEIAVFQAFAEVVAEGKSELVVLDMAPTGHTLLLLDATEAYHRQMSSLTGAVPDAVRELLPRLRDPGYAKVLIVCLPEATPVHEADRLERDLRRARIEPFAWVINRSLTPLAVTDPILASRRDREAGHVAEVRRTDGRRVIVLPYRAVKAESACAVTPVMAGERREGP